MTGHVIIDLDHLMRVIGKDLFFYRYYNGFISYTDCRYRVPRNAYLYPDGSYYLRYADIQLSADGE